MDCHHQYVTPVGSLIADFNSSVFPVNPGSSARLSAALASPNSSYDGSEAITAYAEEARNENA